MTEVEKKRIGKAEIVLVVCAVLIGILVISGVIWLYTRVDSLQNQIATLEIENSDLQSLTSYLQTENSQLESEIDSLNSEHDAYVTSHQYTNSQYDYYVANHQYTNWEYDLAQFDFYYVLPIDQNFGVYALDDELYRGDWVDPYEKGVFDCSEMSAYMEWELENLGWHTIIVVGDSPFGFGYHAWLLVETSEGAYMPVEATTLEVVWWDDPYFDNYWIYDYEFETILDALDYSETEFDWWN